MGMAGEYYAGQEFRCRLDQHRPFRYETRLLDPVPATRQAWSSPQEDLLGSRCPFVVALSVTLSLSCGIHATRPVPSNDGDRIFITADQIAHSGSTTAWEALRKLVPQLTYGEK